MAICCIDEIIIYFPQSLAVNGNSFMIVEFSDLDCWNDIYRLQFICNLVIIVHDIGDSCGVIVTTRKCERVETQDHIDTDEN